MVRNNFLLIIALFIVQVLSAESTYRYLVFLKDKPAQFDPTTFFTKSALEKRVLHNIPFDVYDIPCNQNYIDQLDQLGAKFQGSSRWFNAVQVNISDPSIVNQIKALPFVVNVQAIGNINGKSKKSKFSGIQSAEAVCDEEDVTGYDTLTFDQIHQMRGEYLHNLGYKGQGVIIAILDAGFTNANIVGSLQHIYTSSRLLGTYDYVQRDSNVYESSSHGLNCFGLMGAFKPDKYKGSAVDASFYLFKTENVASELLSEEYFLAEGLERCDELGVDIATISLGYTQFDSSSQNHTYADLDGHTTVSAKAVNKASSKGILVLVAAGNEGSNSWHYISTPSDADSAICVAAVDASGNPAGFSSYGFPSDSRIKPNVACRGVSNPVINSSDGVVYGSGTSYATPLMAGMAACLWQAFPAKTNWEIKTAIEQSASQFNSPDKRVGYGIPNFEKAYTLLSPTANQYHVNDDAIRIYPNPFSEQLVIHIDKLSENAELSIMNLVGQTLWMEKLQASVNEDHRVNTSVLSSLPKGVYLVQLANNEGVVLKKIIKD